MSWLSNCSIGTAQNGVFTPEGFSRIYGCNVCNPDIFGKAPEREERKYAEEFTSCRSKNLTKIL